METEVIARTLKLTAQLMELHNENPFKVKSLSNAAFKLDKTDVSLVGKSAQELEAIEGIGKSIAGKILELQLTGTLKELDALLMQTPKGVIEMLGIKGIGPKKVAQLWKELEVESPGELLYACNENRLTELKGFGAKTQEAVRKAIEFNMANKGLFHYASLESFAIRLVEELKKKTGTELVSLTGSMRRKAIIIDKIEILLAANEPDLTGFEVPAGVKVELISCSPAEFPLRLFETTGSEAHLNELGDWKNRLASQSATVQTERDIYKELGMQYIEPELREGRSETDLARKNAIPPLIELQDLKGILHNHSTWSDGLHSLQEMAEYCKELGYEYLGICDHSQSAFYANGLKPDRVAEQHHEIDLLNATLAPFRIFKGIESDILFDGSLDYPEEVLDSFDFVVASVHSVLKMDETKATARLIKAIENPYTTILGHPTGRLLLSREGYPVDHKKVIDACAAHGVIIELNAHPYRLDIDWTWIAYCMEKGVRISINPDAHEKQGYHDMYFGVCAARKGMLTKEMCFNSLTREQMAAYFLARKPK
ncbi:MAG TPA: helix-hairpin-helix domain-containing protein [Bacteroidia bacterium]|jgi:DNA polymerase (family 10)|nr:helix-hairpin-helix domain-containing protein [Bacteroidia bacterium]